MKTAKLISILLILSMFFPVFRAAAEEGERRFETEVNYWDAALDGKVRINETGITGTEIDLVNDIGLDEEKGIPEYVFSLRFSERNQFHLSYFSADYSGSKLLTKNITYKGQNFAASTNVSGSLEMTIVDAHYGYSLVKDETLEIQPCLGVKYAGIESSLSSTAVGSISEEIKGAVPVIGLRVKADLGDRLIAGIDVSGVAVDIDDIDGSLIDLRASLRYNFSGSMSTAIGYRLFDIDVDSEGDTGDVTIDGPFVSVNGIF